MEGLRCHYAQSRSVEPCLAFINDEKNVVFDRDPLRMVVTLERGNYGFD
jgi:hypothetical protein